MDEVLAIVRHKHGDVKDPSASDSWKCQSLILDFVQILKVYTEHFKHTYSFLL